MSRFDFTPIEAEPHALADMYAVLGDAESSEQAECYAVPAGLQTREYAAAVIWSANTPDLASARLDTRLRRETILRDAAVPRSYYVGAAALRHTHWGDKNTVLRQIDHLRTVVEEDIEAGPDSLCKVGIMPVSFIRPLPGEIPAGMSLVVPQDVRVVETAHGAYVMGNDCLEVDRIGTQGIRSSEVRHRQSLLKQAATVAVFGEAALELIDESRAVLLAA